MNDWRDLVRSFDARAVERYESIDLNRLIVFVLTQLQEAQIPTTFETVTVVAFRQFPVKFGLVGFSEYPDAARVGRALLQLRPKYRNWATGDVKRGFVLNEAGRRVAREVAEQLDVSAPRREPSAKRTPDHGRTKDLAADLRDVESSALFKAFVRDKTIETSRPDDFYSLLGAYPYAPRRAIRDRLEALRVTADQTGRTDTEQFLVALRRAYRALLTDIQS